ncbi:MAG: HAD-IA family hydrolase [Alphaproteobacteria bacterium]|nr:HAD-IA family hydrolase [Alphaproteobacteria bacterium]
MAIKFPHVDMEGARALLVDIDNTLYHYDPCHAAALQACWEMFRREESAPPGEEEAFKQAYRRHRDAVTRRLHPQGACRSRLLAFQGYFEEGGYAAPYARALAYDRLYWESFIDVMEPEKGAQELLARAKEGGLKVVAVTDMVAAVQFRKIVALGFSSVIDFIATSEEAGAEKPSPLIFNLALEKTGAAASEAVMVGDSEEKDIAGARALGLRAYRVLHEG